MRTPPLRARRDVDLQLLADHLGFVDRVLRDVECRSVFDDAHERVERRDERRAMLFHQRDAFVVDVAAVLDRGDARTNRVLDAARSDRVCGDAHAVRFRFQNSGAHLFLAELIVADDGTRRQYAARRDHLDAVGAGFELFAHRFAHVPRTVGLT